MGREIKDGIILPENILRAVTMMDVPIDDEDVFHAVLDLSIPCGDCGIVEQAKSHGVVRRRMMTGRTDKRESSTAGFSKHGIDRRRCGAGRQLGDSKGVAG